MLVREAELRMSANIEYRGDPKQYISVVLAAIDHGRLTYDGVANREQTFCSLVPVIDYCFVVGL